MMATISRLSFADVRAIFDCLHDNKDVPKHLKFTIVPVGPTRNKLSPPSYEFEDGLFVLLKPKQSTQKRKIGGAGSDDDISSVPSFLAHLVEDMRPPEAETCPWSLSGPQYPHPTAIQQRYCYPKGDPEYSSRTGGALFTMYGRDGKESLEFRVLHVYRSAKRAGNQGMKIEEEAASQEITQPNKAKGKKRPRTDPSEDLVVDIINTNGHRNNSAVESGRSAHSIAKHARETFSPWQQSTPSPTNIEGPVAILSPRLPMTSVPTKWRSLAIRILECSERTDADQLCYNEVLSFLKEQKGHRIIPEEERRCSNGKMRQLNEALDVLWASLSSSDIGDINEDQDIQENGSTAHEEGEPQAKQTGHRQASLETTLPITLTSLSGPSLSLRTRKASSKTNPVPQQSPEKKLLRRPQEPKHSGKAKVSYESDDGSLVI